jgi:hypothetical protein
VAVECSSSDELPVIEVALTGAPLSPGRPLGETVKVIAALADAMPSARAAPAIAIAICFLNMV